MFAVFFTPSPPFARFDERSEASQKVGTEGGFLKEYRIIDAGYWICTVQENFNLNS
ncbi:MAG: hypothetical protein ACM34M_12475 [Ignavibacteria bacterium]